VERLDSFHLDNYYCESYETSCFEGYLSKFLIKDVLDPFLNSILTIYKRKGVHGLVFFLEQSHHWDWCISNPF